MRAAETQWWIIELPDEWQAEQDEETIVIRDEDGVGEIAITTLEKADGTVDDAELLGFAEELIQSGKEKTSVQIEDLAGYYFCYEEEGDAIQEWYLSHKGLILFITYACDAENAGMDDGAVNEILATIFIKEKE